MAHSILYFGWLYLHCHKTDKLIISAFLQWFNFFLFLLPLGMKHSHHVILKAEVKVHKFTSIM